MTVTVGLVAVALPAAPAAATAGEAVRVTVGLTAVAPALPLATAVEALVLIVGDDAETVADAAEEAALAVIVAVADVAAVLALPVAVAVLALVVIVADVEAAPALPPALAGLAVTVAVQLVGEVEPFVLDAVVAYPATMCCDLGPRDCAPVHPMLVVEEPVVVAYEVARLTSTTFSGLARTFDNCVCPLPRVTA